METINLIIKISALIGAVLTIWGVIHAVIKWFQKQEKQTSDIEALKKLHMDDMSDLSKQSSEERQVLNDELCVISYAVLAALDGLMQLGANGNVTKAHEALEKHLNKQAHGK